MSNHSGRMRPGHAVRPQHSLLARRSLVTLGIWLCLAGSVHAQDNAASDTDTKEKLAEKGKATDLDTVEVRGVRASLIKSQVIKRDSDQIVDSVSAEDIGALPDRSVTETLQRVSGVTIDHFMARNDTDHFSAEGSGVMIRGMTQVRGELNGRDIFSANSGRGLSFEDVPSELMAGVDVYKNPSADIIEGGLGGTVNLRTFKPFDFEGRKIAASVDMNRGDMSKENKPSASFLFSDRWNTGIGEVGALFDVAYSELATTTQGVQVEPYLRHTATDGYGTFSYLAAGTDLSSVYVPGGVSWRNLDFERKRLGIASTLQWRPDDDTTVTLQYLRSEYRMSWLEHAAMFADSSEYLLPDWGTQFSYSADGVFEKGSPISYIYSGDGSVKFTTDARYAEQKTVTQDISLGFERYLTDHTILSADAQLVRSWSSQYDLTVASSTFLSGVGYDLTGEYPTLTVSDSSAVTSSSNYYWNWAMDHFAQNQGRELALRLDLEHDFDDQFVRKIKFGVRSTDRNQTNKSTPYNWNYLSETWDSSGTAGLDSYLAGSSSLYSFGNFFRGQVNVPTSLWFPSTSLVKNYAAAVAALESFASSWSAVDTYDLQYINRQKERTQAAYAIAYFGSDEISTPIDGNFGVRVVQTSTKADGYGNYPDFSGYTASDLGDLAYLKTQFTGQYFPIEGGTQYTNVLPSFNLRVKFTNDLQWRFAVSKAVSRPDMDKLTANMFLYANTTTGSDGNVTVTSWTGTAGNPNLKPMRANQVDTALEWYFDNTDMMYLTLFYKDVRDYIATQTRTETYDGVDFSISRPYNMSHGYIRGAEWGYTQFFDSLPGFLSGLGVSANYTYVDSKGSPVELLTPVTKAESGVYATLPLEGLSKRSYNAALIYEKYDFSFRLAYNWRSRYLLTTSDANVGLPMWSDDFGQLDASLFYNINSHLKVGLQATNITDAVTKVLMGPSGYSDGEIDSRLYSRGWFINDRRYSLVLRMNW